MSTHVARLLVALLVVTSALPKKSEYHALCSKSINGWYRQHLAKLGERPPTKPHLTIIVAPPKAGFGHNLISAILSLDIADALNASVYLSDDYWHQRHTHAAQLHNSTVWAWVRACRLLGLVLWAHHHGHYGRVVF